MTIERNYDGTNFITGMRAVAVFLVFLIHSGGGGLRDVNGFFNNLVDAGKYGIEIFFVISGFTIYYQFLNAGYSPSKFIMVRFLRISIPYFALLLVLGVLFFFGLYNGSAYWLEYYNQDSVTWQNFIGHFFYLGAFMPSYANTIIGVEWTLNVEATLYLLFFLMVALFKVQVLTQVNTIILFLLAMLLHITGLILSLNIFNINLIDGGDFHFSPAKWLALFLIGGLAYHLRIKFREFNVAGKVLLSSFFIVLTGIYIGLPGIIMTWLFAFVAFLLIVGVKDSGKFSGVLNNKTLIFFGSISFSFYLIHFIVIHYVGNAGFSDFIISLGITSFIAFCWYYVFEKIAYLSLKRKLVSR